MDIEFADEQKILQDSVERMLRASYDFDRRRAIIASEDGWSEPHWQEFANLGLLAAPFPRSRAVSAVDRSQQDYMEAFGRHLVVEPYFETVVLAGGLIDALGAEAQRRELLDGIMSGRTIWALALLEARARHELHAVSTTAECQADSYVLHGAKAVVVAAPWADRLIVSARTYGSSRDREGAVVSLSTVRAEPAHARLQNA